MIRNYIASQIQEISALRALRFFGAALALTHFFTAIFWLRSDFTPSAFAYDAFHVDLSSPEWSQFPICWPQLPNCQAWRILPTSGVVPMLLVYGGGALLSALLFVRGTRMTVAYTSLCALFVFKLYLFSLDYRLMGNYHYMPFWIAVAYLLLPAKRTLIPALLVGFYVAAGALKFDKEWLSGAALVRPAMLNGALLRFLLAYVVFLEVVLAWGLLARRPLVFWPIFSQFVIFHLFSFHIVGPFYPMTMACLLSILILDRQLELSPEPATASSERTGRFLITRPVPRVVPLTLAVFMAFQFYPATIPGDSAITGEGRMFALNMLDAKTQCDPTIYARFKNRTEELSYQRRDLGIRIWCDPIVYWNMARTLCERHRKNPDFVDLDLFLTGRKSTEHVQKKVIELRDFCKHQPQYSTWRDNDWITDEVESDLLPRYGLGYRPVPRAMPERPEQGEPKATTFLYRGDPARRGGALNSDSNDFRYTRVEATWRRENGNVGIHNASKASAAVDASGVYIGGDSGWFFAYDHEGRLKWKFHVAGAARGIHGTPALDEDFVYLGAYNGRLYKLRKTTGEVEWAN
ncbi:MAG: PQQ-binding-like beta-propeller repeat protein, partial [Bdellovibrionaceae bacterium]|nr:PQQ-binding-like beta-propeller repeat protein [Pseudobdellovibrionaceae bacterium]